MKMFIIGMICGNLLGIIFMCVFDPYAKYYKKQMDYYKKRYYQLKEFSILNTHIPHID